MRRPGVRSFRPIITNPSPRAGRSRVGSKRFALHASGTPIDASMSFCVVKGGRSTEEDPIALRRIGPAAAQQDAEEEGIINAHAERAFPCHKSATRQLSGQGSAVIQSPRKELRINSQRRKERGQLTPPKDSELRGRALEAQQFAFGRLLVANCRIGGQSATIAGTTSGERRARMLSGIGDLSSIQADSAAPSVLSPAARRAKAASGWRSSNMRRGAFYRRPASACDLVRVARADRLPRRRKSPLA